MKSFKHSGDLGDVLYSLPAIRASGGGILYLSQAEFTRVRTSARTLSNLKPLLDFQPYIEDVKLWYGGSVAYDLDLFRFTGKIEDNIAERHLRAFGFPVSETQQKWLTVNQKRVARVVISRSPRYQNKHFPWAKVMEKYGKEAVFVGGQSEHEDFEKRFGSVPYYKTKSLLDLAEVIDGCELFIGNQSAPFAIAEGLKKRVILEVCLFIPNCLVDRPGFIYAAGERLILPEL